MFKQEIIDINQDAAMLPPLTVGAAEPQWLQEFRQQSLSLFKEEGLPTSKWEGWKYTHSKLKKAALVAKAPKAILALNSSNNKSPLADAVTIRYTASTGFVMDAEKANPDIRLFTLAEALTHPALALSVKSAIEADTLQRQEPFLQLNTAYFSNAAVIQISKNSTVKLTIEIGRANSAEASAEKTSSTQLIFPRLFVIAEENATADIHQTFYSTPEGTLAAVSRWELQKNATINLLDEGACEYGNALTHCTVDVAKGASFNSYGYQNAHGLRRQQLLINLTGEEASCDISGVYLDRANDGKSHTDLALSIKHLHPNTESNQTFKGVLNGKSSAVFNGLVYIKDCALGSKAKQLNQNILLSDQAKIVTRPQMEIYADEVTCTHGATVGKLDAEQLFYLQSRGLSPQESEQLLLNGFIRAIFQESPQWIQAWAEKTLSQR